MLEKALESYKKASSFPKTRCTASRSISRVGATNLADYVKAMDMFKSVVLYGELPAAAAEKDGSAERGSLNAGPRRLRAWLRGAGLPATHGDFAKVVVQ